MASETYSKLNKNELPFRIEDNGLPTVPRGSHLQDFSKKHQNLYKNLIKKYYYHHKQDRRRKNKPDPEHEFLEKDPAVQRYFSSIKARPRNHGFISENTEKNTLRALTQFLRFIETSATATAISELIKQKREAKPDDFTLEDKLEQFAYPKEVKKRATRTNYATLILGVFKANRARLQITCPKQIAKITKPISEGILREFRCKLDTRKQDLIDYGAYAGQRRKCYSELLLKQIDTTSNSLYAICHVYHYQNKSRQEHDFLVPLGLMLRILDRCKKLNYKCPFPNHEQDWREITTLAKEYFGIRLTSHYLRKRFATIASETPMDVNQWDYLMGSKKSKGHDASVYNLNFSEKLIKNYHTYLVTQLDISGEYSPQLTNQVTIPTQNITPREETIQDLINSIKELQRKLEDKLTKP